MVSIHMAFALSCFLSFSMICIPQRAVIPSRWWIYHLTFYPSDQSFIPQIYLLKLIPDKLFFHC